MTPSEHTCPPAHAGLDMDLGLAARACIAQLPSLAARRLQVYRPDIASLQDASALSPSAQRLARKLFSLMANASVHYGGSGTLRPLFDHLALVRTYLWLGQRVPVTAPEPLVRGTPDLVVDVGGESIWVDTRARSPELMAERGRQSALLVDRTMSMRREPPLRLGVGYAVEFHLVDARGTDATSREAHVLEQQMLACADNPHWALALAAATGARDHRATVANADLEHSA